MKRRAAIWLGSLAVAVFVAWLTEANLRLNSDLSRARIESDAAFRDLRLAQIRDRLDRKATTSGLISKNSAAPKTGGQWDDEAWRAARLNEAILRVESQYGRFFLGLNLSPEKLEALKQQMARNQLKLSQAVESGSGGAAGVGKKVAGESVLEILKENNAGMEASLGKDDYAKLQTFNFTETYRSTVDQITNAMRSKGLAIGGDMEESVLGAYSDAIRDAASQALSSNSVDSGASTDEEPGELKSQQLRALQIQLQSRLSHVLTEQQLDGFMESEAEQSSLSEAK